MAPPTGGNMPKQGAGPALVTKQDTPLGALAAETRHALLSLQLRIACCVLLWVCCFVEGTVLKPELCLSSCCIACQPFKET